MRRQRLYAEVRRALRAFYVKPRGGGGGGAGASAGASVGAGWARWEAGGRRKLPADAEALPGPLGGQRLLVQPAGKADADAAELPKARRPQP